MILWMICISPVPTIHIISDPNICSVSLLYGECSLLCNYPSAATMDIVANGFNTVGADTDCSFAVLDSAVRGYDVARRYCHSTGRGSRSVHCFPPVARSQREQAIPLPVPSKRASSVFNSRIDGG